MPRIITEDDLFALEMKGARGESDIRDRVSTMLAWVSDEAYSFGDDLEPAEVLGAAADHLLRLGDLDEALEVADTIERVGGAGHPGAVIVRIEVAAKRGDDAIAHDLADGLRRRLRELSASEVQSTAEMLGELFEEHEDLRRAERWFTMGYTLLDDVPGQEWAGEMLLLGRLRVRHAAGKPRDGLDEEVLRLRAARGLEPPFGGEL